MRTPKHVLMHISGLMCGIYSGAFWVAVKINRCFVVTKPFHYRLLIPMNGVASATHCSYDSTVHVQVCVLILVRTRWSWSSYWY